MGTWMRLVEIELVELWSSVKSLPPIAVKPASLTTLDMAEAPHSSSPSPHSDRGYELTTPEELTIPVSQALKPMTLASARHQEPWRHRKS